MKKHKYLIIALAGFVLWFVETWYFGWNETAQSAAERALDMVSLWLIVWGTFGDISNGWEFHRNTYIDAEAVNMAVKNRDNQL